MSKESDLELLNAEYSLFEGGDISSIDDVKSYLEIFCDDLEEYECSFKNELKSNRIYKLRAVLANYFAFIVGYEFPEYYDNDSLVVKREISCTAETKRLIRKLISGINESNYEDIYRLGNFIRSKYFDYYSYFEKCRTIVELEFDGIYMHIPSSIDFKSLLLFLDNEFNRICSNKSIEKKKVI